MYWPSSITDLWRQALALLARRVHCREKPVHRQVGGRREHRAACRAADLTALLDQPRWAARVARAERPAVAQGKHSGRRAVDDTA